MVVPVCNEAENVGPLAAEIARALAGREFEILFVDDGSTDGTAEAALASRAGGIPQLRLLRHSFRSGQSAAVCSGVRHARAEWIATLDGEARGVGHKRGKFVRRTADVVPRADRDKGRLGDARHPVLGDDLA